MAALSRLLLIEADEHVAEALSRALLRQGWTVRWAATARTGLQLQAEWAPHVVLLALNLPDMAAGELVARLAKQGSCGILVLSGHDRDFHERTLLTQGAHDVMSKPMRASDVAAAHTGCAAPPWPASASAGAAPVTHYARSSRTASNKEARRNGLGSIASCGPRVFMSSQSSA